MVIFFGNSVVQPSFFGPKKTHSSWDTSGVERVGETEKNLHCSLTEIVISLIIICMMYNVCLCCVYIYIWINYNELTTSSLEIIEGSLEVKLPTIWTVEKQR